MTTGIGTGRGVLTRYGWATMLLAVLGLIALPACGGGDNGDAEFIEALTTAWETDDGFGGTGLDVSCLAEKFTKGVGGAEVIEKEYGVTAANVATTAFDDKPLSEAHALDASKSMFECDGFKEGFVGAAFADGATDEQITCLSDSIEDEPLVGLMASTFMGDNAGALEAKYENDFEEDLFAGLAACDF